jgi:ATP-dependent protease ClpP protease subunit
MEFRTMTGHIFIYGGIGRELGEVSIQNIKSQLEQNKGSDEIILHMVTNGGDVFEGYGIYNILKNSGKKITTHVEGLCASIGTLIGWAGETVVMNRTAEWMVHNPKISDIHGESHVLRNVAEQLDKIKELLVDVAHARTIRNGKSIDKSKLWELYDNETWLTAQQALEMGFVDDVQDAIKAVAKVDLKTFKMENKENWLTKAFKNLVGLQKVKNQFTETLQDGTIIIVMSDDEDWTGKQVLYEDGTPVPAGDHTLASGKVIKVDDQSVITQVTDPAPVEDKQDEEMENKVKELEAQLAEAKDALAQAQATASTEAAKSAKFENRLSNMEKDYLKIKEEMSKTFGDKTEPAKGPTFKASKDESASADPMDQEVKKYFRTRNLIKNEED